MNSSPFNRPAFTRATKFCLALLAFLSVLAAGQAATLWLSTKGPASATGQSPTSWSTNHVVSFDGPGLSFGPNSTAGSFKVLFGFQPPQPIRELYHVNTTNRIGNPGTDVELWPGDLLITFNVIDPVTIGGVTNVQRDDVLLYRPGLGRDYTNGVFSMLLDNPLYDGAVRNVHALTLVERDTTLGNTVIPKGTFLVARSDTAKHMNVYTYRPTSVGRGTTSQTPLQLLLTGSKLGLSSQMIQGLDLLESPVSIGGTNLKAGLLLVSVDAVATFTSGPQNLTVQPQDIFILDVSKTEQDPSPNTDASAALFFDGSNVGLDDGVTNEQFISFTLIDSVNLAPYITALSSSQWASVGDAVNLTVTPVGEAPLTYQWFRNGTPVAGATNTTLFLTNAQVGDSGNYTVQVSNSFGSTTSQPTTLSVAAGGAAILVTTTNDSGAGSLRQAILDASGIPGAKTIRFNIPNSTTGALTINLLSALPGLTNNTVIDGYTQPGASRNKLSQGNDAMIKIRLSGTAATGASGLRISNPGCAVYGLAIGNFAADGIYLFSSGNAILQGNFIGLDPDGVTVRTNSGTGVRSTAAGAVIGGPLPWQRNVISGNLGGGVSLQNSPTNMVQGNYIGTDASGTLARGNNGFAVQLNNPNSIGNVIGGELPGEGNVIAATTGTGSNGHGIYLVNVSNNRVQGNFVGTDATGLRPLGNLGYGIYLTNATVNNLIGGTNARSRNVIAYNARAGVHIASGTNGVLGNSIFENGGLGIDLGAVGVQANDLTDADIGPNKLQNYPVISAATNQGGVLQITGSLRSRPNFSYRLEFFTSPVPDTSTNGEGKNFIGATSLTTTSSLANFTVSFPSMPGGDAVVTATATGPADTTSEFSSWRVINYTEIVLVEGASQHQSAPVGGSASFSITARGAEPISYQWFFNGTPLAGATSSSLVLNNLTTAEAGVYQVVASNSYGSVVSQSAGLEVKWITVPNGLAHWWAGDNNTLDYIGTNDGTMLNGATYRAGKVDDAFAFNGTNHAVDVGSMPWLSTATGMTVMAWIHRTNVVNRMGGILGRWQATAASNSAAATSNTFLLACGEGTISNRVKLLLQFTNLNSYSVAGGTVLPTNEWIHVAATWDGAGGVASVYLNGIRDGTTNVPVGQRLQFLPGYSAKIGTWGNSTNSVNQFRGGIDEVMLLSRPLSENEIQSIYTAGAAGVLKAPDITAEPEDVVVLAGGNTALSVAAVGALPLSYQWNIEDTPIPDATNATLLLTNAQAAHAGHYDVLVSNPAGSTLSRSAQVRVVLDVPVITAQPEHTSVFEGETAMFSVAAVGSPPLTYQWRREGSALAGQTNSMLTLTNVALADAGRFSVIVSNASGPVISQDAVLTVLPVPPNITTQPTNQTVNDGGSVSFTVVATGTAPLFYQWARNGSAISSATNATLSLTNVGLSAGGNYTVIVSNVAGSATSQAAVLTVQPVAPVITSQPVNRTVNEGTNVSFTVVATGTGPLSYQWARNAAAISGATSATLDLSNVALSASGNYTVVVSNAAASVISSVAVLTVQAVAPTITTQPVNRAVIEGTDVSFVVAATGTGPLAYQWARNTTAIHGATNTTLSLTNVPLGAAGNYTVIVSNSVGSVTSAVAVLMVQAVAPAITSQPASRTVLEGTNVSFTVVATGTAPLSYQWARNTASVGGATGATLNLTNVALSAAGNYTVIVSNAAGSVTSVVAVLTVQPAPPTITAQPVDLTVNEGTNVFLSVVAIGTAPLSYQWARNSTNLAGATNATLSLSNVAVAASGNYTVTVSNSVGSATSQVAVLTVQPLPPAIVTQPGSQTVNDGSSVSLTVVAASSVPLTYQWARNTAALPGATNATLSLSNVALSASGNYTVVVSNAAGSILSSVAVLTVQAMAPTITTQPAGRTVNEGTNVSFNVVATGTAPLSYQWAWNTTNLPGATTAALALNNVGLGSSGNYTVIVSNSVGSVTSVVAVLAVQPVAPKITSQPASRTVFEGTNVSFTVAATGTAPLSYRWMWGTTNLSGVTNLTLNFSSVALSASGNYTVIVSNIAGSVTSVVAVLTVQPVPPAITTQPVSLSVNEGNNASFWVVATGTAPLSYQWARNAVAIASGTNATLNLTNVALSAGGNFFLIVSNPGGSATSQVAVLTVQAVAPTITTQPVSQTAAIGSNATLSVVATGTATLFYQWQRSGQVLPGQTGSTLSLTNLQPGHAGSYRVVVRNEIGSVHSDEATLNVVLAPLAMTDNFSPAVASADFSGAGYSSNTVATAEPGEPLHDGKPGGKSMWFAWRAPAGGIATFATAGSDFDSLLAVYQGSTVNALTPLASDDDDAGYFNSTVSFNAESNGVYQIAVDGSGGATGKIVLAWSLESTADRRPVITNQPVSQVAVRGANVTFTVGARGGGLTYQWYLDGDAIPGATGSSLLLTNVSIANVGAYRVHVSTATRTVKSRRAHLQLKWSTEFDQDVGFSHKFREMITGGRRLRLDQPPSGGTITRQFAPAVASRGYTGTQIFSAKGSLKEPGEPDHCGIPGGASVWCAYQADANGVLALNTDGSSFDTVLAVYTGPGTDFASLVSVACDNDSGTNGQTSSLHFIATSGTTYYIVVDDVNGIGGTVVLNYTTLGEREVPTVAITAAPPANSKLTNGNVTMSGIATDTAEISLVEWRLTNSLGATDWTPASGTNAWTFTASNLNFGPNLVEVRAWDSWANVSAVVSRRYILLAPLTVSINGCGSVSRGLPRHDLP